MPFGSRLAIGSIVEEYSNTIQVLGHVGERDAAGQPRLSCLASANHLYPATKVAFQPSSLSTSSSSDRDRGYMSPSSKSAKRASWGANQGSPSPLVPNEESHDGYPNRELLASTADCLRIWECARNADSSVAPWESEEDEASYGGAGSGSNGYAGSRGRHANANGKTRFSLREKSVLAHSKTSMSPPAPLTSFSWNQPSPNLIVTSSIDTTCTIWDLPTRTALTQLIAHDREVYDVDWCPGSSDVFASVGADGSVRVFDLRSLEHSTIIYETAGPPPPASTSRPGTGMSTSSSSRNGSTAGGGNAAGPAAPLLRIAFNPWDANYLATFHLESDSIQILDVRAPGLPILELKGHKAGINAVAWGPPSLAGTSNSLTTTPGGSSNRDSSGASTSSSSSSISKGMICTASDDAQVLVYDLASSTLRSASAQGRRSRNSTAAAAAAAAAAAQASPGTPGHRHQHSLSHSLSSASLASSSGWGSGTPVEHPFLAYEAQEMVNNVAWFRPGGNAPPGGTGQHGRSASMEWSELTANASRTGGNGNGNGGGGQGGTRQDWMACVAGRELRAMRVS
ncbi:WD40 repeat-like protein [Jaminaea rosea]|uniref:WD40 repeat-like protein n=1 Tax=Jaminaea rosea TaxID=1569628 RepID=A0A316UUC8_9BASI|nr:WD40 repeat-like protein [Jaminaea rosea]PWN28910.1 WD40 repeat-like protein [Jaminaea rosea]